MDLMSLLLLNSAATPTDYNEGDSAMVPLLPADNAQDQPGQNAAGKGRRKRLRRHPVWEFFGDVADKVSA